MKNPKLRQIIESVLPSTGDHSDEIAKTMKEQPFVSQLAWAYFFAYIVIIRFACVRAEALRAGIEELERYLNYEKLKEVLKAALPHKSQFIEASQPEAFHDLLDDLEERLLAELKNLLEGRDLDEAAIVQAKYIVDASNKLASQGTEAKMQLPGGAL